MKAFWFLFGGLALAGCDAATQLEIAGPVVVSFAQPFPANAPDLPGFLPRDCKDYAAYPDSGKTWRLRPTELLVMQDDWVASYPGEWLDAQGIPRRLGSTAGTDGLRYRVTQAQPARNTYRVYTASYFPQIQLTGPRAPRLRYYRGWYYLSTPAVNDSTKWTVRRLGVGTGYLVQQLFNPDSLRVRALAPAIRQQRRAGAQLFITLAPQSRRAIRQVSSYGGLWLDMPADPHLVLELAE
jgi:hypothetical protein